MAKKVNNVILPGSFGVKNCAGCHKEFVGWVSTRYCSVECRKSSFRQSPRFSGIHKDCEQCGKNFYVMPNAIKTRKYCSKECNINSQKSRMSKECLICNKMMTFKKCKDNRKKYCSVECKKVALRTNKRLDISANFKDCKTLKLRMNDIGLVEKCNRCSYSVYKEILVVHHIDRNRKNNTLKNLEVLCPNCHAIEHRVKSMIEKI